MASLLGECFYTVISSFMKATLLCCGLALSVCRLVAQSPSTAPAVQTSQSGLDLGAIDKTADPCVDFYQYACGNWLKQNPIPPDKATWGRFDELEERNLHQLRQIAEDSAAHQDRSAIDQKIGAFFASCMDEAGIEKRGLDPLRSGLDRIAKIKSKSELTAGIAWLHQHRAEPLFAFHVSPDLIKSTVYLAELDQGGLGLPDRDYYLKTDAKSEEIRQKYLAHVAKTFELTGVPAPEAQRKGAAVMKLETALAELSLDNVSRRNPQLLFHKYKLDDTAKLTSAIDLKKFFTLVGAPPFTELNVDVPAFFEGFDKLITATPLPELKDYLEWFYITANADLLTKAIVDENFSFYGTTLTGATQLPPRWKRCIEATDAQLGEALGQKFVEKTFGEEGKQRTLELVTQIERAMAADIDSVPWMSDETKKQALIKLKAVTNKIGYPNKWRDYSPVTVANGDYFGNYGRAEDFEFKRQLAKIGKPVDRAEWDMTPPTVNAYYDPQQNNINFPAGILQPPFYSNHADAAVNAGGIGSVIGHELTHGFDDEGRQFDSAGNLRDWWRQQDAEAFKTREECIANEYSAFSPVPGVHLNGELTLGENTADNGGLRLAFMALMNGLAMEGQPSTKLDGYTTEQRFFLGFGQVWCQNSREEELRMAAQTDTHAPPAFRVNGSVSNMPQFSQAFGCKEGNPMFAEPPKACRVW